MIPAWAGEWLPLLMFMCMIAIVYLLWRTLQVMPRVKPTHVQPGSRESVSLSDVAGVTEAKAELQEVIDFLKHPKRFEQLGALVQVGDEKQQEDGLPPGVEDERGGGEPGARGMSAQHPADREEAREDERQKAEDEAVRVEQHRSGSRRRQHAHQAYHSGRDPAKRLPCRAGRRRRNAQETAGGARIIASRPDLFGT